MVNGTIHAADAVALQAQSDLTTAYNDAAGRTPPALLSADLGGLTLTAGVYRAPGALGLTGALTLDAQGDPNSVFIFQAASTLITASASRVNLINGAQPCNVFWQVGSSATFGTTSAFVGNVMALTSISLNNGVTLQGRALARNGSVTLINDTITAAHCAPGTTGGGRHAGRGAAARGATPRPPPERLGHLHDRVALGRHDGRALRHHPLRGSLLPGRRHRPDDPPRRLLGRHARHRDAHPGAVRGGGQGRQRHPHASRARVTFTDATPAKTLKLRSQGMRRGGEPRRTAPAADAEHAHRLHGMRLAARGLRLPAGRAGLRPGGAGHGATAVAAHQETVALLASHDGPQRAHDRRHGGGAGQRQAPMTGARTVLPLLGQSIDSTGGSWLHVRLPGRTLKGRTPPASGWISAANTRMSATDWHLVVNRGARSVSRLPQRAEAAQLQGDRRQALDARRPPASSSSRRTSGSPGAGRARRSPWPRAPARRSSRSSRAARARSPCTGSTNVGGTLGTAVSHGCVRLANRSITWLAKRIKPGDPVTIV